MIGFYLFVVQAAFLGVQVGITVAEPSPLTIGMCAFVAVITARTLLQEGRS